MAKRKKHPRSIAPASREPNGRIQRPTAAQRAAMEKEARSRETVTVRKQPHRVWAKEPADPKLETPFGRFCVARGLPDDLFQAGERYSGLWRKWRLAAGLSCPFGHSSDGTGAEPGYDPDQFWRDIERADAAMHRASVTGKVAVIRMCGYREDAPGAMQGRVADALVTLAIHFGMRPAA